MDERSVLGGYFGEELVNSIIQEQYSEFKGGSSSGGGTSGTW